MERRKRLQHAYETYWRCLQELKAEPGSPDLREKALAWGRYYSNLTRDRKGTTVYDEVALKNDLDAACAGAVHVERVSPAATSMPLNERLNHLKTLL
ncbi:MAG TPA: hypothetical protein VGE98_02655, partial [Thermoanaerobaculia bacterium]